MPFEMEDPQFINRRLCSLEIYVPSQLEHPDSSFEIIASAWFGKAREDIETASGLQSITFGVHSAMLAVETCADSRIEPGEGTRFRSSPLTLTYERRGEEDTESKRQGSFGSGISFPLFKILTLRGEGNVDAVRSVTNAEATTQDSSFDIFEVETASPWEWRIQALNPARPVPRLDGCELRDVALCRINSPKATATVVASVSVSSMDLWLDVKTLSSSASPEDEANQNAVLAALFAKSIETSDDQLHLAAEEGGDVVIASSTLHRRKPEERA